MYADPSAAMAQVASEQFAMNNQQMAQQIPGEGMNPEFSKFLNPKVANMDPATLALMKATNPDANIADSVMKSFKGVFKKLDKSIDDVQMELVALESGGPVDNATIGSIAHKSLAAINYTTMATISSSAVPKTMDTLIKAQ